MLLTHLQYCKYNATIEQTSEWRKSMNIQEAVKLVTSNKNFKTDFSIYALLNVISVFITTFLQNKNSIYAPFKIIALPIEIVVGLITCGFYIITLRNFILSQQEFLPRWEKDSDKMLSSGFKYTIGGLVYYLIFMIPLGILAIILGFSTGLIEHSINSTQMMSLFSLIIFFTLAIMIIVAFSFILPAVTLYFCTKLEISAMFNIKEAFKIIKKGGSKYIKVFILTSLLIFLAAIVNALTMKYIVLSALSIIFSAFITILTVVLYGDFFRTIIQNCQSEENQEPTL